MTEEKQYLTRGQASEYCIKKGLPVSPKTLAKYACVGGGPKFRKLHDARDLQSRRSGRMDRTATVQDILVNGNPLRRR